MTLDWNDIETVLLDMDGTLLDRNFDDHFWLQHVPKRWAEKNHISYEYAQKELTELFRSQENSLNWTNLDYWSDRLKLDIPKLKLEVEHLIAVHPYVVEFLLFLKHKNKSVWLVTNAHSKTLDLKMKKTSLAPYFNGIISAHTVGLPKEDQKFWGALKKFIPYDKKRTLLGEDSETNLTTAYKYGIQHLIYVSRFSSVVIPKPSEKFCTIEYFNQLLPEHGNSVVKLL